MMVLVERAPGSGNVLMVISCAAKMIRPATQFDYLRRRQDLPNRGS
jgi:hypothetical protein